RGFTGGAAVNDSDDYRAGHCCGVAGFRKKRGKGEREEPPPQKKTPPSGRRLGNLPERKTFGKNRVKPPTATLPPYPVGLAFPFGTPTLLNTHREKSAQQNISKILGARFCVLFAQAQLLPQSVFQKKPPPISSYLPQGKFGRGGVMECRE